MVTCEDIGLFTCRACSNGLQGLTGCAETPFDATHSSGSPPSLYLDSKGQAVFQFNPSTSTTSSHITQVTDFSGFSQAIQNAFKTQPSFITSGTSTPVLASSVPRTTPITSILATLGAASLPSSLGSVSPALLLIGAAIGLFILLK